MEYTDYMGKSSQRRLPFVIGIADRSGERPGWGGPKTLYTVNFPDLSECELSEDDMKELAKREPRDSTKALIDRRIELMRNAKFWR